MRLVLFSFVFLCWTGAQIAAAQTAEETVAFIVGGLEDGRSYKVFNERFTIVQTPGKAEFRVMAGTPPRSEGLMLIAAQNECVYTLSNLEKPGPDGSFSVDFSQLIGVRSDGPEFLWLDFKGSCPVRAGSECSSSFLLPPGFEDDRGRLDAALTYFRGNFCRGSAF